MSDRRSIILALALMVSALPLRAQTAQQWRQRQDSLAVRTRRLRAELDSAERQYNRERATIAVGGQRIKYVQDQLSNADTARLAEGLRRGVAAMVEKYGPGAATLVDTVAWSAYNDARFPTLRWLPSHVTLIGSSVGGGARLELMRPIDVEAVSRYVQDRMGVVLARRYEELEGYVSTSILMGLPPDGWRMAARDLPLSWSAVGRRCAAGNLAACTDVVSPYRPDGALERYFDRSDYRAIVSTGTLLPTADSAAYVSRRRCRDGADSACARIVQLVRLPNPIGSMMRGTLAVHAFDLASGEALKRLETAPRGDPVALLAHVAGLTPDSLVRSWRARMSLALTEGRAGNGAVLLSTMAWCGLLLLATRRRRPS